MYMSYLRPIVLVYACICTPCMFIDLPVYRRTTAVTIRPGLGTVTRIPIQSSNFFLTEWSQTLGEPTIQNLHRNPIRFTDCEHLKILSNHRLSNLRIVDIENKKLKGWAGLTHLSKNLARRKCSRWNCWTQVFSSLEVDHTRDRGKCRNRRDFGRCTADVLSIAVS